MKRTFIERLSISGDTDLWPHSTPNYQFEFWRLWQREAIESFPLSMPYVETTAPIGEAASVCVTKDDRLFIFVCDLTADLNTPNLMECTITPSGWGSVFAEYANVVLRPGIDEDANELKRVELHDRLVKFTLRKLANDGLHFQDEDRAKSCLKVLTKYWFDLLRKQGKFDPRRPIAQTQQPRGVIPLP